MSMHHFRIPAASSPDTLETRTCETPCIRTFEGGTVWRGIGRVYLRTNGRAGYVAASDTTADDRAALAGAAEAFLIGSPSAAATGVSFEEAKGRWSFILYVEESEAEACQAVNAAADRMLTESVNA